MPVPDFAHGVKDASYWMRFVKAALTHTAAAKADTTQTASTATPAKTDSGKSFFDDVLDVVNPLQHLPVVGTVYRAITGDKIGDVEKVAGDTLYGGPIGLVSSLADLAFEKITGKDFGDTVMSFVGLEHDDSTIVMAANTPKAELNKTVAANTTAPAPTTRDANTAPKTLSQLASIAPMIVPPTATTATAPADTLAAAKTAPSTPVDISSNTDALLQALARNGVTGQMQTQAMDAYRRTMSMNAKPLSAAVN